MEAKAAVKVGIVVVLGFALLFGALFTLSHLNPNAYIVTVRFTNTKGLVRQSIVRMQGVRIGEVKEVELQGLQPIVTLAIDKKYDIPRASDIKIISGILITNPQVEIEPHESPALAKDNSAQMTGVDTGGALAALDPKLEETVKQLNQLFGKLNGKFDATYGKIARLLDETTDLVKTVKKTATTASGLISDPELKTSLKETLRNFKETSQYAKETTSELQKSLKQVVQNSQGDLKRLTSSLFNILARIDTTLDDANTVVKKLTEQVSDPRLQQSLQETTELAKTTLARFNQIASDIHQLTGDPQLQSDLKQTVENLKNATEKGDQAVKKVNDILGGVTGIGNAGKRLRLPKVELVGNISEQLSPTRLRVDMEARIDTSDKNLINLGLFDLGQNTRLTLQGGNRMDNHLLMRYGLYASRLGGGLEWEPTKGTGIRADLYDTSRPRLDFRALFRVNNDASIWLGADSIFRSPVPVLGIQIRR